MYVFRYVADGSSTGDYDAPNVDEGAVVFKGSSGGQSTYELTLPPLTRLDLLVVAGGGGGGYPDDVQAGGAGGGAGGVIATRVASRSNKQIIVVGSGGVGGDSAPGGNGMASRAFEVIAHGGGGGGHSSGLTVNTNGRPGGSGGGGSRAGLSGFGIAGQGFGGGSGSTTGEATPSSGGGGASEAGLPADSNGQGDGGNGKDVWAEFGSDFGPSQYVGGGGGAGYNHDGTAVSAAGTGGQGGGGDGGSAGQPGNPGQSHTGGGGGGAGTTGTQGNVSGPGGAGGSGVVMLRLSAPLTNDELWRAFSLKAALGTGAAIDSSGTSSRTEDIRLNGGLPYRVHYFEAVGSTTLDVTRAGLIDFLLVAGGGAGGGSLGAGGGAGGVVQRYGYYVPVGTYAVSVGAGSAGDTTGTPDAGNNSIFHTFTALGGGAGFGGDDGITVHARCSGGSGGGGSRYGGNNTYGNPGGVALDASQGNHGGAGTHNVPVKVPTYHEYSGGGGGYYRAGDTAVRFAGFVSGGDGLTTTITGSVQNFAGGGGGCTHVHRFPSLGSGPGGLGGGGGGASTGNAAGPGGKGYNDGSEGHTLVDTYPDGGSAGANTGGGGGGGGWNTNSSRYGHGGSGGSGIFIVRHLNF